MEGKKKKSSLGILWRLLSAQQNVWCIVGSVSYLSDSQQFECCAYSWWMVQDVFALERWKSYVCVGPNFKKLKKSGFLMQGSVSSVFWGRL